jgi:hypothetical protein
VRIIKPKRSRGPVKRLDLTDMRELFRDHRLWSAVGIVTKPDDAESHYEIVQSGADAIDILVEVVTQPGLDNLTCRMLGGVFDIPDEGDEVAVLVPEGTRDFMPVIVGRLARAVPTVQGPQPGRIVIVRDEVIVHDGSGGAVSLARKQDVINVNEKYADHKHIAAGSPTSGPLSPVVGTVVSPGSPVVPPGAGIVTNPVNPAGPPPFLDAFTGTPTTEPFSAGSAPAEAEILGTSVLLGK